MKSVKDKQSKSKKIGITILQKLSLTIIAIFFIALTELIMWLGISKIKGFYLWSGDKGSAAILGLCIIILAFINTIITLACLREVFAGTKISELIKIKTFD